MLVPEIQKAIDVLNNVPKLYHGILLKYLRLPRTQKTLLNYNKGQLAKGIKRDGKLITPFYASIFYKGRIAPVDLKNTGAFYRSFKVSIIDSKDVFIHIFATDAKTPKLEFKYSEKIFGLTESNIEKFVEDFKQYFLNEIERIIRNSF